MKQREAFLSGGVPPDFPDLGLERGSSRRASAARLTAVGRRQMGIDPFPEPVFNKAGARVSARERAPPAVPAARHCGGLGRLPSFCWRDLRFAPLALDCCCCRPQADDHKRGPVARRRAMFAQCLAILFPDGPPPAASRR